MKGWETSTRAAAAPSEEDGRVEASCHCWIFFLLYDKTKHRVTIGLEQKTLACDRARYFLFRTQRQYAHRLTASFRDHER
jgi:hypothetical protein